MPLLHSGEQRKCVVARMAKRAVGYDLAHTHRRSIPPHQARTYVSGILLLGRHIGLVITPVSSCSTRVTTVQALSRSFKLCATHGARTLHYASRMRHITTETAQFLWCQFVFIHCLSYLYTVYSCVELAIYRPVVLTAIVTQLNPKIGQRILPQPIAFYHYNCYNDDNQAGGLNNGNIYAGYHYHVCQRRLH